MAICRQVWEIICYRKYCNLLAGIARRSIRVKVLRRFDAGDEPSTGQQCNARLSKAQYVYVEDTDRLLSQPYQDSRASTLRDY